MRAPEALVGAGDTGVSHSHGTCSQGPKSPSTFHSHHGKHSNPNKDASMSPLLKSREWGVADGEWRSLCPGNWQPILAPWQPHCALGMHPPDQRPLVQTGSKSQPLPGRSSVGPHDLKTGTSAFIPTELGEPVEEMAPRT
ncbi:hypothetical protein P7K49_022625 [Saguinus oedipus]|uniref:Uncharacterized protein n=1 Tax=Saguinus oedipus TaxID=9490 RepID=A0ABQ9UJC1_SAGOE|nr:hypothetical protein P7K49_022625 [Saguinus oedipus]